MSVQKLLAEADRLLEKGKLPEAIEKLKSIVASEPTNQINVTKLANVYISAGDTAAASALYEDLAKKLSEAGKSLVAIAIYKQALELAPENISLKEKFAYECEQAGKLGDAYTNAIQVSQYYLARKKYYDTLALMPLLVRVQPKDESLRLQWLDLIQKTLADSKLIHALVALTGPPGLVSQEFSVGGDAANLSEAAYKKLLGLVEWFPKEPKLSYAAAWAAYKTQRQNDFLHYLHETLRREPDFSLGYLLFARWLSEQQKLNESLFVFKIVKEKVGVDRNVDTQTLTKQIDAFVEKNGWISFADMASEEALVSASFVESFVQSKKAQGAEGELTSEESVEEKKEEEKIEVPAEIELSLGGGDAAETPMELEFSGGATKKINIEAGSLVQQAAAPAPTAPAAATPSAEPVAPVAATKAAQDKKEGLEILNPAGSGASSDISASDLPSDAEETVEFTSIIKVAPKAEATPAEADAEVEEVAEPVVAETQAPLHVPVFTPAPGAVAPQPAIEPVAAAPANSAEPVIANADEDSVNFTSIIKVDPASLKNSEEEEAASSSTAEADLATASSSPVETAAPPASTPQGKTEEPVKAGSKGGFNPLEAMISTDPVPVVEKQEERTMMFSPIDILKATNLVKGTTEEKTEEPSRIPQPLPQPAPPMAPPPPDVSEGGDRTVIFSPVEAVQAGVSSKKPTEAKVAVPVVKVAANITLDTSTGIKIPEPQPSDPTLAIQLQQPVAIPPAVESPLAEAKSIDLKIPEIPVNPVAIEAVVQTPAAVESTNPAAVFVAPVEVSVKKEAPLPEVVSAPAPISLEVPKEAVTQEAQDPKTSETKVMPAKEIEGNAIDPSAPPLASADSLNVPAAPAVKFTPMPDLAAVPAEGKTENLSVTHMPDPVKLENAGGISIIPAANEVLPASSEAPDLGDDLLEGPTKMLYVNNPQPTKQLIQEIKQELKESPKNISPEKQSESALDVILKKAERYTAKRNYYLARKSYRHAMALGGDTNWIKERLREIRKLEMPDSLYAKQSADVPSVESASTILDKLEAEFDLFDDEEKNISKELRSGLMDQIDRLKEDTKDYKTIKDLGIAFMEMGLFVEAEYAFQSSIQLNPQDSFELHYLVAVTKSERREYAEAAAILKILAKDKTKKDSDKISIYYLAGEVLERMSQAELSKEFFEKVANLDANYRSVREKLGRRDG